jgi:hypothetical protein
MYCGAQFGLTAGINYGVTLNTHKSFNNFIDSYNAVIQNSPLYKEDLKPWGASTVFEAGIGVVQSGIAFHELNFVSTTHRTSVDFNFENKRNFTLRQRELKYMSSFGMISDEGFQISAGLGLNLIWATLNSSYEYSNGVESYGEDGLINGVYTLISFRPSLGIQLAYPIATRLSLTFKGDWLTPFGTDMNASVNGFLDFSEAKTWGSGSNYDALPQNYQPSNQSTFASIGGGIVNGDWQEIRLRLGLVLFLAE